MDRQEKRNLENKARQGARHTAEKARQRGETLKAEASEQVGQTASALDAAADQLDAEGQEGLAEVLTKLSRNLGDFASELEHKSIDDLMHDATRMARRNPMLFVAGSVGAGVLLSRFFRAQDSSNGHHAKDQDEMRPEYRPDFDEVTASGGTNADPIGAAPGVVPASGVESTTADPSTESSAGEASQAKSSTAAPGTRQQKTDPASRPKGGK